LYYYRPMAISKNKIPGGVVHELPADLRDALASDEKALAAWEDITPLARNEWICWTITVKQQKTRDEHVKRVVSELKEGMRRPCCWLGCIHRTDKSISPSVQYALAKRSKKVS
jgi:Bacteriocin-protection, YdeI or OmpD-Associated